MKSGTSEDQASFVESQTWLSLIMNRTLNSFITIRHMFSHMQ